MNMLKYFLLFGFCLSLIACKKDDDDDPSPNKNLTLNLSGLEDLGSSYVYEGWMIVNGAAITTGVFTIDANGAMSQNTFSLNRANLDAATTFVLTIEPANDPDPAPSSTHVLAGDFSGSDAALTIGHMAALGSDFTSSEGKYILATPTNGAMNDEKSGLWFLDPAAGPGAGLVLPTLPAGWAYEGWAVINGSPVTTGTFTSTNEADNFSGFSGSMAGPPFPGEDYLMNAPAGQTFPVDLSGGVAVISVEPVPDNSPMPFALKPLIGMIPAAAMDHTAYTMAFNAQAIEGTASR